MKTLRAGTKYRHFKGHIITVIAIARHTETLEEMVVYMEDRDDNPQGKYWVRPKNMFIETVNRNGETIPRFSLIDKK